MKLVMFTPRELSLERGWPGRVDDEHVTQLAVQTLEAFLSAGGRAREHAIYPLVDVAFRAPVLRPPSIRFFTSETTFAFGNTASIYGPEDEIHAPAPVESRFCIAAVVGDRGRIAAYALVIDWCAPSLEPPKDRDFATTIGPWLETDFQPDGFDFAAAREVAARNTRLRAGDLLVAPPFAVGGADVTLPRLGTLRALTSS